MTETRPSISEWFRNRNVLITGATGFLGKVLISKLLLSCPDIGNIFLLIREKRGVDPQLRFNTILQQEPFRVVREKRQELLKKLVIIAGDVVADGMALSTFDRERLVNEVSVVFHAAANVHFDLPLKDAVTMNTKGTYNSLQLAKQMTRLKSFIHISTAYCQCGEAVLEERAYPTFITPESVMSTIDTLDETSLRQLTPKLLDKQPNTYAFSKALSEDLVRRCGLPAGVARPSIVVASWKEPVPGWVDNMHGPTGLMIGAGKGVIRSMHCNPDYLSDIVPCDMVANATIALAWKVGIEAPKTPIYMNVTESGENPISWGTALEMGRKHSLANPFTGLLWYPRGSITSYKYVHWMRMMLLHIIPAYLLDALFVLTGNKPFLVRVQTKVNRGLELLQYYTTKEWVFRNDRLKELRNSLSSSDKKEFFMDTRDICWDEYILIYILGTRRYCLKDDPSTLPRARRVLAYLCIADWCIKIAFVIFILWFSYSWMIPSARGTTYVSTLNEPTS